jgi:hypothetical protein
VTTPYAFRDACASVRPMRMEHITALAQCALDGSYCIDAPELLPAGSSEPGYTPAARGLPTLAVRDL